jgi:hypothetical protein
MNIAAKWLKYLLCIQEAPGSNLVPDTGYIEVFHAFPQFQQC